MAFNKKESAYGKKVYHVFVSRKVYLVYPWGKDKGRTDHYGGKKIDAYWWHIIEFGSVKWVGKPFMRPAFDSTNRKRRKLSRAS